MLTQETKYYEHWTASQESETGIATTSPVVGETVAGSVIAPCSEHFTNVKGPEVTSEVVSPLEAIIFVKLVLHKVMNNRP